MNNERSYQDSLFSRWRGLRSSQIAIAILALLIGALFTMGFRSSPAAGAPETSLQDAGPFAARIGPCHSLLPAKDRLRVLQQSAGNNSQPATAGAHRYVAAWPRAVFHHFTTLENWPTLLDVREICGPEEPVGAGSDFRLLLWNGLEVAGVITEWEEDRLFTAALQAEGMSAPILLTLTIEPVPDGSEVQLDVLSDPQAAMRPLVPATGPAGGADGYLDRVLRRIKVGAER